MAAPGFVWDTAKERSNIQKHGVSFQEAATAFADERGLLLDDPDHPGTENRFILLGMSFAPRLLVVVHAYREAEDRIRIISARKATRNEERAYAEGRKT